MTRLYHIVAVHERTGRKTYLTASPLAHDEACIMLGKMTPHKAVRLQVEEVGPNTLRDRLLDLAESIGETWAADLVREAAAAVAPKIEA